MKSLKKQKSDVIIIGGGVIGLTHAYYFAEKGLKVTLLEENVFSTTGASIRNFGFVTISGQLEEYWKHSNDSSFVWKDICKKAEIKICQKGLIVTAQREQSMEVLESFLKSDMGNDCTLLSQDQLIKNYPYLNQNHLKGGLFSPNEIRINPQEALEKLHKYLIKHPNINIYYSTRALKISEGLVLSEDTEFSATYIVSCVGNSILSFYPNIRNSMDMKYTKLQMLELVPESKMDIAHILMSDTSLLFYEGFSKQSGSTRLFDVVQKEYPHVWEHKINNIIVQQENGNLVLGDSHEYLHMQDPFYHTDIEEKILEQVQRIISLKNFKIAKRWIGFYPYSEKKAIIFQKIEKNTYVVSINRGKGMSICWSLAKENVNKILH